MRRAGRRRALRERRRLGGSGRYVECGDRQHEGRGNSFTTTWLTIHDTDVNGTVSFNANVLAKAALATPFKRPENGVFRPGSGFAEFYFTETGDTNALTQAAPLYGGYGALFKLAQKTPDASTGTLTLFYNCDQPHTGFDNITFLTDDLVLVAEDAGDTLHGQRNALDSLYLFDAGVNYGANNAPAPVRVLAQGRDPSATYDLPLTDASSSNGFQNDGDNEITGVHVSDGDASVKGLFGTAKPKPFKNGWRVFYTRQHGDNVTFEIISPCDCRDDENDKEKSKEKGHDND